MPKDNLSGYSLYQIKADDEMFKLKAGDIVMGRPYPYDAKVSVAFRLKDGYRPDCNQYSSKVRKLSMDEAERALWGGEIPLAKTA